MIVLKILKRREAFLFVTIVVVAAATIASKPQFWSNGNIISMLISASLFGFLALGEAMVIVGRGIDLSVSATLGLSALVVGTMANNGDLSIETGFLLALGLGLVLGVVNGLLIVPGKVPPIIATLATLGVYGSLEFVYTNGAQVNNMPLDWMNFGNATWVGIPSVVWFFLIFTVLVWYFARHTRLGRDIFATGNNLRAAQSRGIATGKAIFATYCISGMLAGIGGFLYICYNTNATATTGPGTNMQLTAIAIALIGGTAMQGGRASFLGVALASVFLAMTLNVAVFFNIPGIWDNAAEGLLILIVVLADSAFAERLSRRRGMTRLVKIVRPSDAVVGRGTGDTPLVGPEEVRLSRTSQVKGGLEVG